MSWTDERIELLKKLWAEGLSARQIADQLGGITRNAVIGKVHRLGLSGRCTTTVQAPVRTPKKRPTPALKVVGGETPRSPRPAVAKEPREKRQPVFEVYSNPYVEPVEELEVPEGERITIETLSEGQCKWPIGDPLSEHFHFCGRHQHGESVYCEFHSAKAYQPSRRKVARKEPSRLLSHR
jgi:GcrA cell cycle regulator